MFNSDRKEPLQQAGKLESSHEINLAEEFIQLFYDKLDKQQYQQVARLYTTDASLIWNGISNASSEKIQEFLSQLPPSMHTVISLDMHRLNDNALNKRTFLIKTGGMVRFKDYPPKQFFQTFFTTLVGDKYKILIDNYRCIGGTP